MNRSIDWLSATAESNNRFLLNRRGYIYFTANPDSIPDFQRAAKRRQRLARAKCVCMPIEPTTLPMPDRSPPLCRPTHGRDSLLIARHSRSVPVRQPGGDRAVHARRCGWFSGQQLGMFLLERAREHGVTLIDDRIDRVSVKANRVEEVHLASDRSINTRSFVNAAGPLVQSVGQLLGLEIPVIHELHLKIALKDHLGIVPRDAPLMIWTDPQYLPWTADERADLAASDDTRWLLEELPGGAFTARRRRDSNLVLMLWAYHVEPREPIVPPPLDEFFPEVVLRGMSAMIPALNAYFGKSSVWMYDGGYYTKTLENRPLAGPLRVEGSYVCGAASGYGLMASAAVGELVAAHVTGSALPDYAPTFSIERYNDPAYRRWLENWRPAGQL
jgi:glycine/D-amino acid oxidase-like deaminating enzyme